MKITLSETEIKTLELEHRNVRDGRVRDRIKAVILFSRGWSQTLILKAFQRAWKKAER